MTKVEYGKNLLLKGVPIIFNKGGAKLKIGENVTIKSSFLSNLIGLYSRTIIVTRAPGAEIEICDNVGISGATIYARKKITIGENTCIGGNCKILDNDFHGRRKLLQPDVPKSRRNQPKGVQEAMVKPEIIEIQGFEDFRGWLSVPVDRSINFQVVQINQGFSKKAGTLRGLHFQEGDHAQAKLVSCLHGSIFNVAVDLRPGDTFGYAYSEILSFENQKQMLIPRGFAHGYLTLEDDTLMQWCVDNDFCVATAKAVRYDSEFNWQTDPWPVMEYILSEKDKSAKSLQELAQCGLIKA